MSNLEPISILIVDDNAINRLMIRKIIELKFPTINFLEASDGFEGVKQYKQAKPELIFMDIQMPVMNGYEATILIRGLEVLEEIDKVSEIIALTAGEMNDEKEKSITSGMNGFILKPFTSKEIIHIVENRIDQKKSQKESNSLPNSLNSEMIFSHFDNDTEQIIMFLSYFEQYFFEDLETYKKSFFEKDLKAFKAIVHKIKPNFALIGIPEYQQVCLKIEYSIKENINQPALVFEDLNAKNLYKNIETIKQMIVSEKNRLLNL